MEKQFLCIWGNWDKTALHDYEPSVEVHTIDFFNTNKGYEPIVAEYINSLKENQRLPLYLEDSLLGGNHIIIRLK